MIRKVKQIRKLRRKEIIRPSLVCIPDGYSLDEIGTTQTYCQAFMCCRMRWKLMLNRWRHASKNSTVLFGGIVHDVLDALYSLDEHPSPRAVPAMVDDYLDENKTDLIGLDDEAIELDSALASATCQAYCDYYADDWKEKKFDSTEQEVSFTFEGVLFHVKIDGRYRDKNDKRWQMEHKTKGQIQGGKLMLHLSIDFQNLLYILGGETEFGEPVKGVLYNIIRKSQLRPGKRSMAEHIERVHEDIASRPDFYFVRFEVPYTERDKESFREDLHKLVRDMKAAAGHAAARVYRNPAACQMPYPCEYLEACASDSLATYYQGDKIFPELSTVKH